MNNYDFILNMKSIPDENSVEYKEFFRNEAKKIEEGFTVDGVYIDGWLYWYTNHWNINVFEENKKTKLIKRDLRHPDLRDTEWLIAEYRRRAREEKKGLVVVGSRRLGKALEHGSIVYKEHTIDTVENLKVGDRIYGDDGYLTNVTGVFPQGVKDIYEIELRDGRKLYACEDHLWKCLTKQTTRDKSTPLKEIIISTKELLKKYKKKRKNSHKKGEYTYEYEYSIPNNNPVNYTKKDLKLNPYLLGLWLGDGSNYDTKITSIDSEIINYLYNISSELNCTIKKDGEATYRFSKETRKTKGVNLFREFLNKYNLFKNKHIPKDYLYSSIEDRFELLKGLMDTDGSISKDGTIEFVTTNEKLSEDFYTLCRGLGINVTKSCKIGQYKKNGEIIKCKLVYRFKLHTSKFVFKLTRKLKRQRFNISVKEHKTAIVSIKKIRRNYATCITVDNKNHCFLTDNYTITHNSEVSASIIGRSATIFRGTENVISAGNAQDLKLLSDKIDLGLSNVHPYFRWDRPENDWKKQVTLGIKKKDGTKIPFSAILPRNLDDGNNTEAVAGITAYEFIIEEIGKFPFLRCLEAAIPAFTSPYGWACSPFLIGTGGAFDKGDDAEKLFNDPEVYNFLAIDVKDEPKKYGLFIPGTYRMESKDSIKLGEWLKKEKETILDKDSELYNLDFKYSDVDKAKKIILEERDKAKKSNDQETYLKSIMYYPLIPSECFLTATHNMFNAEAARIQKQKVIDNALHGIPVVLEHTGEKIVHKYVDKQAIRDYPTKPSENKDCPIIMWEPPITNAPKGVYVAGVDTYKTSEAKYSTSLGAVYIFKRMHNIVGEEYQDMIVASYVARPKDKDKWNEQARLLIKYYNAEALVENDELSFIDYMKSKGDQIYLVKTPQIARDYMPHSSTLSREYGLSRANSRMSEFLHDLLKRYLDHTVAIDKDAEGNIIRERIGVTKIYDTALLDEISKFNPDGNFDRIVAFELALLMASNLDPYGKVSSVEQDPRRSYLFNKEKTSTSSVFTNSKSKKIKNLFK